MKKMISEFLNLISTNLIYFDIGARWGIEKPWQDFKPLLDIYSFEPDTDEYNNLLKSKKNGKVFNYALYKTNKELQLHLTKERGNSSIFKPNKELLSQYLISDQYDVDETVTVSAVSLDELHENGEIGDIDFIKLDVQGAELDILKGGQEFIKSNVLGIFSEVQFLPLYESAPLFSDVDHFIRNEFNLEIQDLQKYYFKYSEGIQYGSIKGKLAFGDALYFLPPNKVFELCEKYSAKKAKNKLILASLMGVIYGYFDYTLSILHNPLINDFFEKDELQPLINSIKSYGYCLHYSGIGANKISEGFRLLGKIFQPHHRKCVTAGESVGSRKKMLTFF
jgi:FkbM family methyltransferase